MTEPVKLTALQLETLAKIDAGEVEQINCGGGAWRTWGGSPNAVGRLVVRGLARWGSANAGRYPCEITEAGRQALHGASDQ